MALKVQLIVDKAKLSNAMSMAIDKMRERVLNRFITIGETFTKLAKENKEFQDHTFNLVSSIGFGVVQNGVVIHEKFEGQGEEGVRKGKELVAQAAAESTGLGLVCVAGENYAIYVESKNFDVITGTSYTVEKMLKESF